MNKYLLTVICLAVYSVIILSEGIRSRTKNTNTEAYYSANRSVGSLALLATVAMSMFSGLSYYGYPGSIYRDGIGYLSGNGGYVGAILFCTVGYRLWISGKEYGFASPAQYLRARYYDEKFGYFVAAVLFIFIIPYVAVQVITIGDALEVSTGGMITYGVAVFIAVLVIGLHVCFGGMGSVAWMDTFHFFLGYGALFLVMFFVTTQNFEGGFISGLQQAFKITASNPDTVAILSNPGPRGIYTWQGNVNNALTGAIATIVWPHVFVRCFMAKEKRNFKVMAAALPFFYALCFIMLAIVGAILAPSILGAGFERTDRIMAILSTDYAPSFVTAISALCLCAFAVSTSDSFLLCAGQFVSNDIYLHWQVDKKGQVVSDKKAVNIGRIGMLVVMALMLFIVFTRPAGVTDTAYKLASPFFGQIMPATIGGVYWRKGTREGAWAGTATGLVVALVLTFFVTPPLKLSAFVWALLINAIVYVVVSNMTKCPEEVSKKYVDNLNNIILTGNSFYDVAEKAMASNK